MNNPTMLVNESHPLPLDWQPDDLVDLWKVQPRHYLLYPRRTRLSECATDAANALFEQAEREGFDDFMILSAFRSSDYQAGLFADSSDGYVARPGCSEHQTGLAMDIAQVGRGMSLDDAHAAWLAEKCWEYGFIVRYPEGREDVTGYPPEPWHLRYVGHAVAMEMREHGWVLEEWHEAHGQLEACRMAEIDRYYRETRLGREIASTELVTTRKMLYDKVTDTLEDHYAPLMDYTRYREIELLAEELTRAGVEGAIAEVGVELGYTSEILNRAFPDRKLYLYDSFDGFDGEAMREESEKYALPPDFSDRWKAIRPGPKFGVQMVQSRLPHRENAIIRQGFFPETACQHDSDVVFAFVMLDVDLHRTTVQGIRFFWPRLANGGYLMIHDYNTDYLKGVHDAVAEAEKELGRFMRVPIPDLGGSLVIQKPW